MEFHARKGARVTVTMALLLAGLAALVTGGVQVAASFPGLNGQLGALLCLAGLSALAWGALRLRVLLRPFRLRIDAVGIIVDRPGLRTAFEWADIEVSVDERYEQGQVWLTVWPQRSRPAGREPDRLLNGMAGYEVACLSELTVPVHRAVEVVRQHSAERYRGWWDDLQIRWVERGKTG
ncbi:hypothetical protein [Longispora albida]|uniref:hypothetical protein n=1 Tax=Longispora albida TaxID=203523 RepID=UPI0003673FFC|nr:hypothetical protein [Longispora albida]